MTSFPLRKDQGYFWTGVTEEGKQVIIANTVRELFVLFFDQDGNYLAAERVPITTPAKRDPDSGAYITDSAFDTAVDLQSKEIKDRLQCVPSDILIKRFSHSDLVAGIEALPAEYQDFLESDTHDYDEEDRKDLEAAIKEWQDQGCFVLVLWGIGYWMSASGEVTSHG